MKLYNTLTGSAELFSPSDDVVKMYVCGITPYAPTHVGHAMRAVVFDVLRRYLEFTGHGVRHIENFTDIDDKMIQSAADEGVSTQELSERHIQVYLREMDALNVLRAHAYPRATQEVPKIQEMVKVLLERGFAYEVKGDVYFRVREHKGYGKLSHRDLATMRAGARVEINENKEDPMDFLLWKSQKPGEPSWDSPWGAGRPGWHIECSAMSLSYLGTPLDIHGAGQDLVFPHNENEIAQTEAYTNREPMARFWVHNGLVRLGEDKMSKSLGNLVTVGEALQRFSPDALRLFYLSSYYRSPLTYSNQGVAAQERAVERLRNAANPSSARGKGRPLGGEPYRGEFIAAMDDDLNTAKAIAVLFNLAREINRTREEGRDVVPGQDTLRELTGVLGLTLKEPREVSGARFFPLFHLLLDTDAELRAAGDRDTAERLRQRLADRGIVLEELIGGTGAELKRPEDMGGEDATAITDLLVETRTELRSAKQFRLADLVRQRLADLGYELEDTPHGTKWKLRAY